MRTCTVWFILLLLVECNWGQVDPTSSTSKILDVTTAKSVDFTTSSNNLVAKPGLIQSLLNSLYLILQEIIQLLLAFIEIQPGQPINIFKVTLRIAELERMNITTLVPQCYQRHGRFQTLKSLTNRLLYEPKTCVLDPARTLGQNLNRTVGDIGEIFKGVRELARHVTKPDKVAAIAEFGLNESEVLADLSVRVKDVANSTITLLLVPTCFVAETTRIFADIEVDLFKTMMCVNEELGSNM